MSLVVGYEIVWLDGASNQPITHYVSTFKGLRRFLSRLYDESIVSVTQLLRHNNRQPISRPALFKMGLNISPQEP